VVCRSGPVFAVADHPILRHRLGVAALLSVCHRLFNAMRLTLIVPELLWPEPDDRDTLDGLACPALTTVIARGRRTRRPPLSGEATLCGAFGLGEDVAYAPLRALGEERPLAVAGGCWICVDPVHLRLHQERLILADGNSLAIAVEEAESIVAEFNRHFADTGTFHVAAPDRWYLRLAADTDLGHFDVLPLSAVSGRRVGRQLPETPRLRELRRLLNEAQMVLHAHPVNERREAQGQSTINSLWMWGAGVLPATAAGDIAAVWSGDPLARGLGRFLGVPTAALPADAAAFLAGAAPEGRHVAVVDALRAPVHYQDGDTYRAALLELEARWFAPLRRALASGRLAALRIDASTAYGALTWETSRHEQWRLWRRPRTLAAVAQALAKEAG
jgi:hypothetical protein